VEDITKNSTRDEVLQWFIVNYPDLAEKFGQFTGKEVLSLSKKDIKEEVQGIRGAALYNMLHSAEQAPESKKQKRGFDEFEKSQKRRRPEGVGLHDPLTCFRKNSCVRILEHVATNNVVLLRSPPFSGKSSLAQLLYQYVDRETDIRVKVIDLLECPEDKTQFEQWWEDYTKETLKISFQPIENGWKLFIIDEVQLIYGLGENHFFWKSIKKTMRVEDSSCRFLLLAMYGDSPETITHQLTATPIDLKRNALSLEDLRFNIEEFNQVIDGFQIQYNQMTLGDVARKKLWTSTLGHPGIIRLSLEAMRDRYWDSVKCNFVKWMDSIAAKFIMSKQLITQVLNSRAVQKLESFTFEERNLLDRLLLKSVPLSLYEAQTYTSATRDSLILKGLIFCDKENNLAITAPIIEQLLIQSLHGPQQALPVTSLDDFVIETLKRLLPDPLRHSLSKNKKEGATIYERQWQMEFYRAARSVLEAQYYISPDYGNETNEGALDFFIDEGLDWGIELVRDGNNLLEHVKRFQKGGAYYRYELKESVILDFRPEKSNPQLKNYQGVSVWYVLYSTDYTKLTIKRRGMDSSIKYVDQDQ